MLPPHPPANRKVANGTHARPGRPQDRKTPATRAEARRIVLKSPPRIQVGKQTLMVGKARRDRKDKVPPC